MITPVGKSAAITAATPIQPVSTAGTMCRKVVIMAPNANTGNIYVGTASIVGSTGVNVISEVAKGASYIDESQDGSNRIDASVYWIDVATTGDKVYFTYETA